MKLHIATMFVLPAVFLTGIAITMAKDKERSAKFLGSAEENSKQLIDEGRRILGLIRTATKHFGRNSFRSRKLL